VERSSRAKNQLDSFIRFDITPTCGRKTQRDRHRHKATASSTRASIIARVKMPLHPHVYRENLMKSNTLLDNWSQADRLNYRTIPSSHPVPAPQIRSHDFWRYINLYICMHVCRPIEETCIAPRRVWAKWQAIPRGPLTILVGL